MNNYMEELSKIDTPETKWLYNQLKNNINLLEISYGYQDYCNYDGNMMSAIDCAMFEAYCFYKKKSLISPEHALLLKNRDGIVGFNYNDDKPIILTVKYLIELYEGNNGFHEWLCDLSTINYYL